jgi:hypothetical protein
VRLGLYQKESGAWQRSLRNGDSNGALAISGEDDGCRCSKSGREAMADRFDLSATKVGVGKSFAATIAFYGRHRRARVGGGGSGVRKEGLVRGVGRCDTRLVG